MQVEDTTLLNYNAPIPQYQPAPSPASVFNDQDGHFVDTHQQYGGSVLGRAALMPGSGYDSGYGSSLSPESFNEHCDPEILQPTATDTLANSILHYPNAELHNTTAVVRQEVDWYMEGQQVDMPEAAFNPEINDFSVPVQDWFNTSMLARDQELGFGAEAELDSLVGFGGWTVPMPDWTQQEDGFN